MCLANTHASLSNEKKTSNTDYLLFRFIFTGNKFVQKKNEFQMKIISLLETSNYIRTNV